MRNNKNKRWLLLLIIIFPSFFWLILESSTINSRKLPYYGPKEARGANDTVYYTVSDNIPALKDSASFKTIQAEEIKGFPLYAAVFIDVKYRGDAYRLTGLYEYLKYNEDKIRHIPFILFTAADDTSSATYSELRNLGGHANVYFAKIPEKEHKRMVAEYFREKPYYIDYSYFVLIDPERSIRGYYDARYVSEIKRLIEEYQHLRLKEEKEKLTRSNEIKTHS